MNPTLIFLIVVVSLFGGIALAALAVFLYFFYKAVKRLTVVAEEVYQVVQPLAAGNAFSELLKSFQATNRMGKQITDGLQHFAAVVARFNQLFFAQQTGAAAEPAVTAATAGAIDFNNQDSFFVVPKEEDAANREVEQALRDQGVETNEQAWPGGEVPLHAQVGDSV